MALSTLSRTSAANIQASASGRSCSPSVSFVGAAPRFRTFQRVTPRSYGRHGWGPSPLPGMFGDIMFGPGTGKAINDMMEEWQREMQRYNKAGASCPPPQQSGHSGVWSDAQQTWEQMQQWLAVDTSEDATSYYIRADVPGLSQKDLKLQLTPDNTLIISGERKRETESVDKEGARRFERRFGKFERKLRLPQDAQTEGIKAQTRDGVLTVTVPKQQPQEPEQQDNANRDIPIA